MAAADLREATTTAPDSPRRSHGARWSTRSFAAIRRRTRRSPPPV